MNPVIPLADPLPQPAPPLLLWALLQLTFLLHLVAMNVVLGEPSSPSTGASRAGRRARRSARPSSPSSRRRCRSRSPPR